MVVNGKTATLPKYHVDICQLVTTTFLTQFVGLEMYQDGS